MCVCVCARACVRAGGRARTGFLKISKLLFIVRKLLQSLILCGGNTLLVIIIVCVCVCVFVWSTEINCFSEIPYGEVAFDLANI